MDPVEINHRQFVNLVEHVTQDSTKLRAFVPLVEPDHTAITVSILHSSYFYNYYHYYYC